MTESLPLVSLFCHRDNSVQTRIGEDDYEFAAARVDDEAFGIGGGGGGSVGGDKAMAWSLHNQ